MAKSHYRPFGAFRCALALGVLFSHGPALTPLLHAIGIGNIAVMTFFVLSGFIIAEANDTFYAGRPFAFLFNRFWRIAPPYWLAVAISIGVHYALFRAGVLKIPDEFSAAGMFERPNIVSNAFAIFPLRDRLGLNEAANFYPFVRFSWAIMVEVLFYFAAFAVSVLAMLMPRWRRSILLAASCALFALHLVHEYRFPISPALSFVPYFLLGACFYAASEKSRYAAVGIIPCSAAVLLHFLRYIQGNIPLTEAFSGVGARGILIAVLLMTAMLLAVVVLGRLRIGDRARRLDRALGDLSYPIYLNHSVVLVCVASLVPSPPLVALALAVFGSIALSWLAAKAIETPLRPLRDRIRGEPL